MSRNRQLRDFGSVADELRGCKKMSMWAQNEFYEDKASRACGVYAEICPQSLHEDEMSLYDLRHNENPTEHHTKITFPYNARIPFFEGFLSILLG